MARSSTRSVAGGIPAAVVFLGLLGAVGTCPACRKLPPSVVSNEVLTPTEENEKVLLTDQDRAEALAAMAEATGPPPPEALDRDRPAPAPHGVRWKDIPLAVSEAVYEEGVELTVVRRTVTPDRYEFELRTVENWPGELVIVRGEGDEVYRIEKVSIGLFPDEPARVKRAEALVKAFRKELERLGAQAWFND